MSFRRLRNLAIFPLIVVLTLGALMLALSKPPQRDDVPVPPPATVADEAPDARANAERAAALDTVAKATAAVEGRRIAARRAALTGIWAPEQGGCAQGYGLAFTDDGRFADGDEFTGVEGKWDLDGDTLIRRHRKSYDTPDDGDLSQDPVATSAYGVDRLTIERLTGGALTLQDAGKRNRYVKCRAGQHLFLDGRVFGG